MPGLCCWATIMYDLGLYSTQSYYFKMLCRVLDIASIKGFLLREIVDLLLYNSDACWNMHKTFSSQVNVLH